MNRKIVQVCVGAEGGEILELFALCDDGSIWVLRCPAECRTQDEWKKLPNLPDSE